MNAKPLTVALMCLAIFLCGVGLVDAQSRVLLLPPVVLDNFDNPVSQDKGQQPDKGAAPNQQSGQSQQQNTDQLSSNNNNDNQQQDSGSESQGGTSSNMLGDFGTFFARTFMTVTGTTTTTTTFTPFQGQPTSSTSTTKFTETKVVLTPIVGYSGFNIAENGNPRPTDRVFFFYNYFDNVQGPNPAANIPLNVSSSMSSTSPGIGTMTNTTTTSVPAAVNPMLNYNREVFGFEKTFLDGTASVEVRLPVFQQQGLGLDAAEFGTLTVIGKYAFYMDNRTGNIVSAGLGVTLPTGPTIATTDGTLNPTLLQPWFGYVWNFDRFFIEAFHSVVVPTDERMPTLMFNDIGFNYWLYRGSPNRLISRIVPTFELHMTDPLTHRDQDALLFVPDTLILTGGLHIGVYRNVLLSLGCAAPVTGPTPFSVEGFFQFNVYF